MMQTQLPKPPVPSGVDLHDFSFTPIFRTQLFRSAFHARASDAEWRAGVTLWLKSWDQMPAGSLPNDEIELCRLAEFGRDQRSWKKVREVALHGWYRCDDDRLYHRVVAEGVLAAYARRRSAADKGRLGAAKRWAVIDGGLEDAGGARMRPTTVLTGVTGTNGPAMQQPLPIGSSAIQINGSAIAGAMPGDSNRQGEGQGDGEHTPLPPLEKGAQRQRRSPQRAELDEARLKWRALLKSGGKERDARVQAAIDAIGGWSRIQLRSEGESERVMREFCSAYTDWTAPVAAG